MEKTLQLQSKLFPPLNIGSKLFNLKINLDNTQTMLVKLYSIKNNLENSNHTSKTEK